MAGKGSNEGVDSQERQEEYTSDQDKHETPEHPAFDARLGKKKIQRENTHEQQCYDWHTQYIAQSDV